MDSITVRIDVAAEASAKSVVVSRSKANTTEALVEAVAEAVSSILGEPVKVTKHVEMESTPKPKRKAS